MSVCIPSGSPLLVMTQSLDPNPSNDDIGLGRTLQLAKESSYTGWVLPESRVRWMDPCFRKRVVDRLADHVREQRARHVILLIHKAQWRFINLELDIAELLCELFAAQRVRIELMVFEHTGFPTRLILTLRCVLALFNLVLGGQGSLLWKVRIRPYTKESMS